MMLKHTIVFFMSSTSSNFTLDVNFQIKNKQKTYGHWCSMYERCCTVTTLDLLPKLLFFANDPGDQDSILRRVILKTQKMVLEAALLNTQRYEVQINGKDGAIQGKKERPPLHLGVVANEKRAFRSTSTTFTNFTYLYIYIYIYARVCVCVCVCARVMRILPLAFCRITYCHSSLFDNLPWPTILLIRLLTKYLLCYNSNPSGYKIRDAKTILYHFLEYCIRPTRSRALC